MNDVIINGFFTLGGAALGAVLAVLVPRLLRNWGEVRCDIYWQPTQGEGSTDSPGGVHFLQRQLTVTFKNNKDIPVTVRSMQVVFYREGKPLNAEERPYVAFTRDGAGQGPFELVTLPPRIPVSRTVVVSPGHNERRRQQAVEEADRIEFVAEIEGAKTISTRLAPWSTPTSQTQRC